MNHHLPRDRLLGPPAGQHHPVATGGGAAKQVGAQGRVRCWKVEGGRVEDEFSWKICPKKMYHGIPL